MSLFSQSWVEKYRPQRMDDICSQDHIIKILNHSIMHNTIPHLLFYGSPGTGKTTTILTLAKHIYHNNLKQNVMVLNASDERGIGVVRNKVKAFAQTSITKVKGHPNFKLIVLDEADSMTSDAQAALRRIIEDYSHITRFCIICNYVSRIIDPLVSRCFKFYFKPITDENIRQRLRHICDKEECLVAPQVIDSIISVVSGDLRRAISILEVAYKVHHENLSRRHIEDYAGYCPEFIITKITCILDHTEFDFNLIHENAMMVLREGYPIWSVLHKLLERVLNNNLDDELKSDICWEISKVIMSLQDGADEYIQFVYILSYIFQKNKI